MASPKEIATTIYHNGHIVDDPVHGSMYTSANPIFFYVSRSITFTQFIRKINNHLPARATEQVAQLLFPALLSIQMLSFFNLRLLLFIYAVPKCLRAGTGRATVSFFWGCRTHSLCRGDSLVSTLLFFNRVIDTHILPMINFLTESDQHH